MAEKDPRGIRNNNPLNIRKGSTWQGEKQNQTDTAFEEFVSMEYGIRAALKLIRNHISGFNGSRRPCNTLRKLITVWAPPTENKTQNYIDFVSRSSGVLPSQLIRIDDKKNLLAVCRAMAFMECGVWLDEELFESAWNLM